VNNGLMAGEQFWRIDYGYVKKLRRDYESVKSVIEKRLEEFRSIDRQDKEKLFAELTFCVLTPQSSARRADTAVRELSDLKLLLRGGGREVYRVLRRNGVRFPRQKARYVVMNRRLLSDGKGLTHLLGQDPGETRERLVKEVWGFGYKEASHFLRNIGYTGIAILDRHILRCLRRLGVLVDEPNVSSRRRYMLVEQQFMSAARMICVAPEALDLLLWYEETGEVFK